MFLFQDPQNSRMPPHPSDSEFENQIEMIRLSSKCVQLCCNYFQLCQPPSLDIERRLEGKQLSIVIFSAESTGNNCASIVFNCACTAFSGAGPHFEIVTRKWISKLSLLISDFEMKMVSINWVLIVLNYKANNFERTRPLSEIWTSSSNMHA